MALLAAYWLFYFALHSLLASDAVKARLAFPRYRLYFNLTAILLLLPAAGLLYGQDWPALWTFRGPWKLAALSVQGAALIAFLVSLRHYDMGEFLGLKPSGKDTFTISPFHRHVRHPWYFLALLIVWTSDMNTGRLATAVLVTAYLFLGSRHEESMLIRRFGDRYARYREKVPGLIPLPWKHLSAEEAETLVK